MNPVFFNSILITTSSVLPISSVWEKGTFSVKCDNSIFSFSLRRNRDYFEK